MQPVLLASSAEKRDDQVSGTGGLASLALAPTTTGHRGEAMTTGRIQDTHGTSKEADTRRQGHRGFRVRVLKI